MNDCVFKIKELLERSGKTVAAAESISAGHIQTMLASISGSSHFFKGGITAYTLSVKAELLGVDPVLAGQHDCVHMEVAKQMARGALRLFKSDYAIATCGYAEAYPEQNVVAPFAHIAIARKLGYGGIQLMECLRVELQGDRIFAQIQTAKTALESFRHKLS